MNMRKMSVLGAGALCISGVAAADGMDVTLTFDQIDRGRAVEINYQSGDNWDSAARVDGWSGGEAGRLKFNDGSFEAFCAEIDVPIAGGVTSSWKEIGIQFIPSPDPMGAVKADVMRAHFAQNYASLSSNDSFAGFAMVIWEIAQEGWNGTNYMELDFALGAVQIDATAAVLAEANAMIAMLSNGGTSDLDGWTNHDYQDLITVNVVPGPSIALAGLIGLAGIRRRRRN